MIREANEIKDIWMKTLAQIAEAVGVSQATVSRVVNGKPGVSDETRQAVLHAMKELGTLPGEVAQAPATLTVGVITPELTNPIFSEYLSAINIQLTQAKISTVLCVYSPSSASEESCISLLIRQKVNGIIFLAGSYDTEGIDHSRYLALQENNIPAVFINCGSPDVKGKFYQTSDEEATIMALRHLANQGHKRIGLLLGDRHHYPAVIRYNTAMKFAREHNLEMNDDLVFWTTYGIDSGRDGAQVLLHKDVTAIVCGNDQLALGALRAAKLLSKSVPHDVSITGFDDSAMLGSLIPALTTVRQPVQAISRTCVQGLLKMIQSSSVPTTHDVMSFEPELIVRESTAINPELL